MIIPEMCQDTSSTEKPMDVQELIEKCGDQIPDASPEYPGYITQKQGIGKFMQNCEAPTCFSTYKSRKTPV